MHNVKVVSDIACPVTPCYTPETRIAKCGTGELHLSLVIRVANYPYRLGPSGKHFLAVTVLHLFMASIFFPNCEIHTRNYVLMFYL